MNNSTPREFVVGGCAAMSASCFTHPIDLLKVRMLLHGELQANQVAKLNLAHQIFKQEGAKTFYRGLSATLVRQGLYSTTRFGCYDLTKKFLLKHTKNQNQNQLPYSRKIIATLAGGAVAATIACPADMMLVRMQAGGKNRSAYRNVFQGLYTVAQQEGIKGWYRGLGPLVTRGMLVTTAQFSTYDQLKETLMLKYHLPDNTPTHFLSSFGAGLVAAMVSAPLDVIKSRMMNNGSNYRSSFDCLWKTIKFEGPRGLFKGLIPCYMRMGPQVILMWNFVEQYRKLYHYFF